MRLAVLGLNHKTAPVTVRERFSFDAGRVPGSLVRVCRVQGVREAMLVSTCNRTELYVVMDDPSSAAPAIMDLVRARAGTDFNIKNFYHLTGMYCARHMFRVAASLDSMIVGEGQILSQLKTAFQIARATGTTSTMLNTLVNRAVAVGKRVRAETRIAVGNVSVPTAAVDLAEDILGGLKAARTLIVGAGEMAELTARHLIGKGARGIIVCNRSPERARELADRLNAPSREPAAVAAPIDELFSAAADADIIITSTGAPHYILTEDNMRSVIEARASRPLVFIDIAVPRDVDPALGEIPGVSLYNVDDLQSVVDQNKMARDGEVRDAETIIAEELAALEERLRYFSVRPVMLNLREKAGETRDKLLRRAAMKLADLSEAQMRVVENLTWRLMHKMLREPMIALKSSVGSAAEGEYMRWVSEIFSLERPGEELGSDSKIDDWD